MSKLAFLNIRLERAINEIIARGEASKLKMAA